VDGKALLIFVGVVLLVVILGLAFRGPEAQRLRRAWYRSTPLPRAQAEELLARHLVALKERFPNRSEAWYLKKVLSDLRRDRR
jgi:hypothetical protein